MTSESASRDGARTSWEIAFSDFTMRVIQRRLMARGGVAKDEIKAAACEVVKKRDAWLNQTRRLCGGIEEAHADQPVQRKPHAAAALHLEKIRSLVATSLCQSFQDRPLAGPSLDMILVPLQERVRFA